MAKFKQRVQISGGENIPSRFVTRKFSKARRLYFDDQGKFTSKKLATDVKWYYPKPIYRDQYGNKLTEAEARAKKVKILNLDSNGRLRQRKPNQKRIEAPVIDTVTEPTAQEMFNNQVNSLVSEAQVTENFTAYVSLTVKIKKGKKTKNEKRFITIKGNSFLNWENFSWELWNTYVEIFGPYLDSPQLLFLVLLGNIGFIIDLDNSAMVPEMPLDPDPDDEFTQGYIEAIKEWGRLRKQIINKYWA